MTDYTHLLKPRSEKVTQEAGFLRRAGAFVLDILLLDILVTAPFASVFSGFTFGASLTGRQIGAAVAVFLIAYAYFVVFEYTLGKTVGMTLLGLNVKQGRLWQHLVRNSFLLPFFPFPLFWIIEPLAILFYRAGVLERLSNTRTYYSKDVLW